MSEWTITGESGRALGATGVDLELTTYSDVSLTRTNQGVDTLSFFVASENPTADPPYLPEFNQQISLRKNGVRQFLGYVGKPKFILQGGIFGWSIEAQHGWNELDRVALTTGDSEYVRAQGSLSATVTDIINKAIAGGARIALGSVATMFDIPAISFRGTQCGNALAELLQIVPDAVAYFTYAGTAWPQLVIARRGSMTAQTFTFGTSEIVEPFSCSPIPGVTPSRITVAYATRDNNGIVTETIQSAGSGSDVQSVILTGSNFADFQAKAAASQVTLRTVPVASIRTWSNFYALDSKISGIAGIPNADGIDYIPVPTSTASGSNPTSKTIRAIANNAIPSSSTQSNVIVQGAWATWMEKLGMVLGSATIQATFYWLARLTINGTFDPPEWAQQLVSAGAEEIYQVQVNSSNQTTNHTIYWNNVSAFNNSDYPAADRGVVIKYTATITVPAISRSIPTATALRDPGDYGTLAPPSTLAANLLAAQNFLPYEGQLSLSPWESPTDLMSRRINFAGLTSRLAGIGALVQSETLDVLTGAKSAQLGLAARQGQTALGRLRKLGA